MESAWGVSVGSPRPLRVRGDGGTHAMRPSRKDELIRQVTKRIAAAQVELALSVEELMALTATEGGYLGLSEPVDSPKRPVADRTTFSIRWSGKTCHLGLNVTFRLFERLARRPNCHVSYAELLQDAWLGDRRSDEAIRSAVRHLKAKLRKSGMEPLAVAIQAHRRHYVLNLDGLS